MKYNFNQIIDRTIADQRSMQVEENITKFGAKAKYNPNVTQIPMWVADMSFPLAPCIVDALKKRIDLLSFGYPDLSKTYYQSIINWQTKHHNIVGLSKDKIGFCNGVVGGIVSALSMDGSENDAVLIHNPCYIGFKRAAMLAKRKLIYSDLVLNKDNVYSMNYQDMEEKIVQYSIKKMIICNPHNPLGRVWTIDELSKCVQLAIKYNMTIICDEIWSDIVNPNQKFNSIFTVENAKQCTIGFYAGSKTFSIAGLCGSYDIVFNSKLKELLEINKEGSGFNHNNALSTTALQAGYLYGEQWVEELNDVIASNLKSMADFINSIDGLTTQMPQATYMLYVKCDQYLTKHAMDLDDLLALGVYQGVLWQDGRPFGWDNSIRINVALPPSLLNEAINRLTKIL